MQTKVISLKVMALFMLPVLILSACSGGSTAPAASAPTDVPAVAVASTATAIPPTPTEIPATETALPPTETAAPTATSAPVGEGELKVLASFIQMDRGFLPWVEDFTAQTGCEVTLEDLVDYNQAQEAINAGGVDVIIAGASSSRLIADGLVDEIDTSRVPSWASIDPQAVSAAWNSADGKFYGVPYLWIPYVLMYDTDVFPAPPTSWNVVFEEQTLPDGKSNAQRVAAPYDAIYIGDAAKYLMSTNPEAGITDPYRLNSSQYAMTTEQLYKQRQILGAYWLYYEPMMDFATNGYVASLTMPRVVKLMAEAGIPVSSTVPQEGSSMSAFTNMLVKDAPHPVCAYQWMEYALDAKVQGDSAASVGANPFVAAACQGASDALSAEDCERNGADRFSEFSNILIPTSDCGNGENNCIAYDRWLEDYTTLVGQ